MTEQKKIKQKELLMKINEVRKKMRENFLREADEYLEESRRIVAGQKRE